MSQRALIAACVTLSHFFAVPLAEAHPRLKASRRAACLVLSLAAIIDIWAREQSAATDPGQWRSDGSRWVFPRNGSAVPHPVARGQRW